MIHISNLLKLTLLVAFALTGCATRVAPVSDIETLNGAINVPYRISSSGRILVDVSVNAASARPLAIDTGATVSVLYGNFAKSANLEVSEATRFVRGLVGQGERPIIEDAIFHIGHQGFQMDQVVMLETPPIKDEAVGLLGGDILSLYVALFNQETMTASFVPRAAIDKASFAGWTKIPLQTFMDAKASSRLYFANMDLDGRDIPVLIDTGSNLNFINWKLATLDESIREMERDMIRNGTLQGALDTTTVTRATVFHDLKLGKQSWDEVNVMVMGLGALETVAPVDEPMMVAGASVFTPHTVVFDLAGLSLFIRPEVKP